ncbi:MAG: hypothetical protein FJZ92_08735 [Chloroflexi bacterium]|nr:hypothetical protein [Chloroflexota bacterium]
MDRSATTERPTTRRQSACVHHWIIEAPNGRESRGVCRNCGRQKSFVNSTESVMWEQTNTIRNDLRESSRFSKAADIRLADED